ncbi:nuclear transport factor 2 family protein [Nocardioides sp. CPCC 205120]|uniref:nuclear transport factor 2 family protein n=1 Tax=Nocardioides sp. CPCC 205120 TaxID=3406462 RepID=UPI003B514EE4
MTTTSTAATGDGAGLGARAARAYYAYARAVDEGDLEALRDLAADDVRVTRGDHPTEQGVEAFLDVYRAHVAQAVPLCRHVITNVLAERDGDEVRTHAYFQATYFEEERTRVMTGTYADSFREVGDELVLAHKRIRVQRTQELPAATGSFTHAGR